MSIIMVRKVAFSEGSKNTPNKKRIIQLYFEMHWLRFLDLSQADNFKTQIYNTICDTSATVYRYKSFEYHIHLVLPKIMTYAPCTQDRILASAILPQHTFLFLSPNQSMHSPWCTVSNNSSFHVYNSNCSRLCQRRCRHHT